MVWKLGLGGADRIGLITIWFLLIFMVFLRFKNWRAISLDFKVFTSAVPNEVELNVNCVFGQKRKKEQNLKLSR